MRSKVNAIGVVDAARIGLKIETLKSVAGSIGNLNNDLVIEKFNAKSWLEGLSLISTGLKDSDYPDQLKEAIEVDIAGAGTTVLPLIGKLDSQQRDEICNFLRISGDLLPYVSSLQPTASAVWEETPFLSLLAILAISPASLKIKGICSAINERMNFDGELAIGELEKLVISLNELDELNAAVVRDVVEKLETSGVLYRRIKNYESKMNSEIGAIQFRWAVRYGDLSKRPTSPTGAPEGFEIAKTIGTKPEEYNVIVNDSLQLCSDEDEHGMFDALLHESSSIPSYVALVTKKLLESKSLGLVVSADLFCKRFDEIMQLCTFDSLPNVEGLVDELLETTRFVQSLSSIKIESENAAAVSMLVAQRCCVKNPAFEEKVRTYLDERTTDEWKATLTTGDDLGLLAVEFKKQTSGFELGGNLADAIESILSEIVDGTLTSEGISVGWNDIVTLVPLSHQKTLAAKVIERSDKPDKNLIHAIPLLAARLADAAAEHDEDSFVRNTLRQIVRSGSPDCISWLANVVTKSPKFWDVTSESDKSTFADDLREAMNAADDSNKPSISVVVSELGIDLTPSREQENDDS